MLFIWSCSLIMPLLTAAVVFVFLVAVGGADSILVSD